MNPIPPGQARRVLQVLGALDPGGIESWLVRVLRRLDPDAVQLEFLVQTDKPGIYEPEVRARGGRVHRIARSKNPFSLGWDLGQLLQRFGPYDVVHSHVDHASGMVLLIARQAGVPVRIAHSHTDREQREQQCSLARRLYLNMMKALISRHATCGLAASQAAARSLFGPTWQRDRRFQVLPCGVDTDEFKVAVPRVALRRELGIPSDAIAVGHVGRFTLAKNQQFFLRVAAELASRDQRYFFVLVGDGPTRGQAEQTASRLGIAARTVFPGTRTDVPALLCACFDVFVFPSHYEGLGLALVEAQAADLPCVASAAVPLEADVAPDLVQRLELDQGPAAWADAVVRAAAQQVRPGRGLNAVQKSRFEIRSSVADLLALYAGSG